MMLAQGTDPEQTADYPASLYDSTPWWVWALIIAYFAAWYWFLSTRY